MNGAFGDSGTFTGTKKSLLGIHQLSSGYYSGTFSGALGSGNASAIVTPDGSLYFYSVDTSTTDDDGGTGTVNSTGSFSFTSPFGTQVSGSLNTNNYTITGVANYMGLTANFTLTRQDKLID